ncbi:MAG: hypothetical protein Q4G68_14510, partial [Planctomycetia bacterium]|nr:hypothetical protein [Planctomycetia bacterium]
ENVPESIIVSGDVASEDASAETTGAFYTLSQRPLAMPVPASGPARQESLEEKSRVDAVQVAPERTSGETFQRRLSQKREKAITPNHFNGGVSLRDTDSPRRSIAQFEKSKAEESMSEANADGAAFSLPAVFNSLPATGPQGQEKTIDHNAFHLACRTDRLENSNVTIQIQLCAKAVINDLSIKVVPMESRYEAVLPAPALAANDEQTATVENRESAESAITEPSGNIAKWVQLNPGETRTIQWTYMPSPNSEEDAADPVVAVIEISGQAKDAASPFRYSFRALVTDAPNAPDQEAQ